MKMVINYLLKDFDNYKLVLKNKKNCEFIFKTQGAKSIEDILLARYFSDQRKFLIEKKNQKEPEIL